MAGTAGTHGIAPHVGDLAERLQDRLEHVLGNSQRVRDLQRLSGGASRETWSFVADSGQGRQPLKLILRRDPPTEPRPEQMRREAVALQAARRHGVPGPDLVDWSDHSAALGAPYLLMTFVPGETIARRILRDQRFAQAREMLTAQLGRAAAMIHEVRDEEVGQLPTVGMLECLRSRYETTKIARPVLEVAFQWLEDNPPPPVGQTRLVHGDFRLGNVIVNERGLAAVLDWELVHRGDPMEDLGYLCIRAWRFGGRKPVAGVGEFSTLFDAYAEVSGVRPDPEVVYWWQVAGTLSWGIGCLVQANRHFSGATRSVELAAIGRRVAEQEHDLLRMVNSRKPTRSH